MESNSEITYSASYNVSCNESVTKHVYIKKFYLLNDKIETFRSKKIKQLAYRASSSLINTDKIQIVLQEKTRWLTENGRKNKKIYIYNRFVGHKRTIFHT